MTEAIAHLIQSCQGFEWDEGNAEKNQKQHGVTAKEAEEIFFNQPQMLFEDVSHSQIERRFGILGVTDRGRGLAVFFTVRNNKLRVISARDQNRSRERHLFETKKEAA